MLASGCGILIGLDQFRDCPSEGGPPQCTGAGGAGAGGHGSAAGGGGAGGGGTGGGGCVLGKEYACYDGPPGTRRVGACHDGMAKCLDGVSLGECKGQGLPTAEICGSPADEDCNGAACSETVAGALFGDSDAQFAYGVADCGDGFVVVGGFNGTVTFGATTLVAFGQDDGFVAKFSKKGKPLWAQQYGDANQFQGIHRVACDDQGNIFLATAFEGTMTFTDALTSAGVEDILVAKLDPAGTPVWGVRFGDPAQQLLDALALDPSGNPVIAGTLSGTVDFGGGRMVSGSSTPFIAKLKAQDGTVQWVTAATAGSGYPASIAVSPQGNVYVGGSYSGTFAFSPQQQVTSSGGDENAWLGRFDPDGNIVRLFSFGASGGDDRITSAATDPAGNVFVAGYFGNTITFGGSTLTTGPAFLAKLGPNANHLWSTAFEAEDTFLGAARTGPLAGSVAVGGDFLTSMTLGGITINGSAQGAAFAGRVDQDGNAVWLKPYDGLAFPSDIAVDDRFLVIVGSANGPVDFGGGTLTPMATDAFMAQIGL
jgi:hypothetical protein